MTELYETLETRSSRSSKFLSASTQNNTENDPNIDQIEQYYTDELGFYRHLDLNHMLYVCSNVNAMRDHLSNSKLMNESNYDNKTEIDGKYSEFHVRGVRRQLRISHFDRTKGYEQWKQGWDEFMRAKLAEQRPVTLNRELKIRIRSGIPHDYRCKVWAALIRMRTKHIQSQLGNENVYAIYAARANEREDLTDDRNNNLAAKAGQQKASDYIPSNSERMSAKDVNNRRKLEPQMEKFFRQIELDLLRTLPNNRHFEEPNSLGIQRVRRVLRTYAKFNPTVGYCQGMNRLAAMALLILPEEGAFWCLVAIIQCIMPKDYYLKPWLAQVDCFVLTDLLEKKLPKLHKHLVSNDIQLTLFTWFFTIFVDGFRPELMLRIWDCFLLEGDKVLFRFALAILYISQETLLKMHDFSSMNNHLSRLASTQTLDVENLFEIAFNAMDPFPAKTLQSRREYHMNRMQSLLGE